MEIKRQKLEQSQEQLIVEVEPEEIKPLLTRAASDISYEHKIPGFRPGKAPLEIIKERFGLASIWQQAAHIFIQEKYGEVLAKANVRPIDNPQVEILTVVPNQTLVFKIILTSMPKVLSLNYDLEKEKIKTPQIKQEEVEKILKNLQFQKRKEKLINGPSRLGDRIEADIDLSFGGVPLENGQMKNTSFILGEDYYIPGLSENLLGMKANQTKEFSLKYPKDYRDKKLAGKTIDFKVKINNIYSIDLPAIDDKFAQDLNYKNLEDLKNQIKANLEKQAQQKQEQQIESKIFEELIQKAEIEDIPQVLIDRETDKMIAELKGAIENQGIVSLGQKFSTKFDDYLKAIKKTESELRNEFRSQAIKRVKIALIIREIAQKEKIEISQEEIEQEIEQISRLYKSNKTDKNELDILKQLKTEAGRNYLKNVLSSRKVISLLKEKKIMRE